MFSPVWLSSDVAQNGDLYTSDALVYCQLPSGHYIKFRSTHSLCRHCEQHLSLVGLVVHLGNGTTSILIIEQVLLMEVYHKAADILLIGQKSGDARTDVTYTVDRLSISESIGFVHLLVL